MKDGTSIFSILKRMRRSNAATVAVVIPVYNITSFMKETLRSVVDQNYPVADIIVVDDGSPAEAAAEIKRICNLFRGVTLLRQQHAGAAVARSRGMAHSSADFLVFLDADDTLAPGALRYLSSALLRHPDAIAAYGKVRYMNERGTVMDEQSMPTPSGVAVLYNLLERRLCFVPGSICIRKKALEKLSPENHAMQYGENWVLWCHLALSGNIIFAGSRTVLYYRQHSKSLSVTFPGEYDKLVAAYDTVFTDPKFSEIIGKERLLTLQEKCLCRLHMCLVNYYLQRSQPEKAAYHWEKITLSMSSLIS